MDATTTPIAHLDDLAEGAMKMIKVDGRRVCLVRTSAGVHALDHACPHEGYGLTQGSLDGELLTCRWHNWKFRVSDGSCVLGEEAVRVHDVVVDAEGGIHVTLSEPDPAEQRVELTASLRRAIENDYVGQIARDVVRLLKADANPGELIWEAVAHGAPRGEFGWGHSIASATDCLAMIDLYEGDQRALPIVQGIAGISESDRLRPIRPLADPVRSSDLITLERFRSAVESESTADAQAIIRGAIQRGDIAGDLRAWFLATVSDHHLSYGHGAIYVQKAFELLEMIGWERCDTVLPHLVTTIVELTREDALPYMRPFMRQLETLDLAQLSGVPVDAAWKDDGRLLTALLGTDRNVPLAAAREALLEGAGVHGLLDVAVDATSERMLRYDVAGEFEFGDDFGWLDLTHGLTYAHAARWHHGHAPNGALRLACFALFLAHWTGRHEWHTTVAPRVEIEPLAVDVTDYGNELQRHSLLDGTTAFIVHAHAVKTSRAAALEAARRDITLPLDAAARFLAAPKLERFVAATVHRSIDFLNGAVSRD
jgi:nitrite reductase/ring-hydroxylating ferredoxin subunit